MITPITEQRAVGVHVAIIEMNIRVKFSQFGLLPPNPAQAPRPKLVTGPTSVLKYTWYLLYSSTDVWKILESACMNSWSPRAQRVNFALHNYGNPYEKLNMFVARPHLWLQLGMVKPEIMLCETVLNLSTLNTLTYLRTYYLIIIWISALLMQQSDSGAHVFLHALKPKANTLNTHWVSNVF